MAHLGYSEAYIILDTLILDTLYTLQKKHCIIKIWWLEPVLEPEIAYGSVKSKQTRSLT